jgi:hypothetical protein
MRSVEPASGKEMGAHAAGALATRKAVEAGKRIFLDA